MWPYCHSNQTNWLDLLLILVMVKKYRIAIWSGHQRDCLRNSLVEIASSGIKAADISQIYTTRLLFLSM